MKNSIFKAASLLVAVVILTSCCNNVDNDISDSSNTEAILGTFERNVEVANDPQTILIRL